MSLIELREGREGGREGGGRERDSSVYRKIAALYCVWSHVVQWKRQSISA